MNRFIFIGIVSILCFHTKAQKRDLVSYPYREINVGSISGATPMCYLIETREEFNKICRKKGITIRVGSKEPSINFFREIVLGVKVSMEFLNDPNPYYHFELMQDKSTKDIHFFVYYILINTRRGKMSSQTWIAIPKPLGNYQVHFHLINGNETETRIYKPSQ